MTVGGAPNTPPNGPPPSEIQISRNLVGFDPKQAVPQQPIYFQRNDIFLFLFATNGVGVTVFIQYRWLTPEGEIKEGLFQTPPFTGAANFIIPLYEGWLLSFASQQNSAQVQGQWVFVQAMLARSPDLVVSNAQLGTIWQGFIPSTRLNGWPGTPTKEITDGPGTIRSIVGSTPAAGADINEVVPANRRWILLNFSAALTTSAAVANRNVSSLFDDGANIDFQSPAFLNQAASLTFRYSLGVQPNLALPVAQGNILQANLPLPLKGGQRIKTSTLNIQAGDQWTAPNYTVIEWGTWDI